MHEQRDAMADVFSNKPERTPYTQDGHNAVSTDLLNTYYTSKTHGGDDLVANNLSLPITN